MDFEITGDILFCNRMYSNAELNNQVNYIKQVVSQFNLDKNEVVGIALPRSPWLLSSIFAMLQMKIGFMLIDLTLPKDLINYMIENAKINNIIVLSESSYTFDKIHLHEIKLNIEHINEIQIYKQSNYSDMSELDDCIAYILYTSGSTGKPKAVEITRKGLLNFIKVIPEVIEFHKNNRIACFTHFTFDIFLLESVLPLCKGLTVILASEEERDNPKKMGKLIVKYNIQMLQMTPSRMQLLHIYDKDFQCLKGVDTIMVGGEIFPLGLLKELQKNTNAKIYNMYGPTETTIWSTISDLTIKGKVDIGHPIRNTEIFLLDSALDSALMPSDEGEIVIAGDGLAKGYRNNDEQTMKLFTHSPYLGEKRIYKTGDFGKYDVDGNLICLGRIDNQIKLRGHRIELEQIDVTLEEMNELEATITCYNQTDLQSELVTFYISKNEMPKKAFESYLKSKLPDYMIPRIFIKLDKFIYTSSGKVDRKAMLGNKMTSNVEVTSNKEKQFHSSPNTKKVIEVINDVLGEGPSHLEENTELSELPINSINYVYILVQLEQLFNIEFEDEYLGTNAFKRIEDISLYIEQKKRIN